MKNIVYFEPSDTQKFDADRFEQSLRQYANIPHDAITKALATVESYDALHVSRLVQLGINLISEYGDETAAKDYYTAHQQYFGEKFERLRRITGYLVGTLDRWNDGKKAEERDRVKHNVDAATSNVDGVYTPDEKDKREVEKMYADRALGKE